VHRIIKWHSAVLSAQSSMDSSRLEACLVLAVLNGCVALPINFLYAFVKKTMWIRNVGIQAGIGT